MSRWRVVCVCVLLALVTLLLYLPVWHFAFTNYDDPEYVTGNPMVQAGLTWAGFKWAFTTMHAGNWHPLTWLSLMLDCEWFGVNAGGMHLVNVLFHAANAVLLLMLLLRLTGAFWPSAFIAALFAWHPLHVESVAWVAERKDVLSAFFGLLTLIFYVRYAQKRSHVGRRVSGADACAPEAGPEPLSTPDPRPPGAPKPGGDGSALDYALALVFFALGLLAKPMLVTLPFVFLLLDYWPLTRIRNSEFGIRNFGRLLLEKLPFFALTVASCVVTYIAQQKGVAVAPLQVYPFSARLGNAAMAYVTYLIKSVYPVGLSVIYPLHPGILWEQIAAAAALAVTTGWVWRARISRPWLLIGWLWYLGMLVPMIGLVQVGHQSMADRYTYLPLIGVSIAVVFGLSELAKKLRVSALMSLAGVVVLAGLLYATTRQLHYWRNSITLFRHAVKVTRDNPTAQANLGVALAHAGQPQSAIPYFQEALRLEPDSAWARNNLGYALAQLGRMPEAIQCFQDALRLDPTDLEAQNNLGNALLRTGHTQAALAHLRQALRLKPDSAATQNNLAEALAKTGHLTEALPHFREAVRLDPFFAPAQGNLALALLETGQVPEAIRHFQAALRLDPHNANTHINLGVALSRARRTAEAIRQFEQALQVQPLNPKANDGLGQMLLQAGQRDEAIARFRTALRVQPDFAAAHSHLGEALVQRGRARLGRGQLDPALADLQEGLQLDPDNVDALGNLAWVRAACPDAAFRNGAQALKLAQRANQLSHGRDPALLGTLAAADAEAGRFPEATATARKALQLLGTATNTFMADVLRTQIGCYQKGVPYRDRQLSNAPAGKE